MGKDHTFRAYFVDEAGDGNLFDEKGRVIIGQEGCSRYFILGVIDVPENESLSQELSSLRKQLLSEPYFKNVPSMQPSARKTFNAFHAKYDVPEVCREVFQVISKYDIQFMSVVRNKTKVLEYVRSRRSRDSNYRYNPNELYDYMVRVLFKNLLHKDLEYSITFSKRGNQDRTKSLKTALDEAKTRFAKQWNIDNNSIINVYPTTPKENVCLQVVDYFLWALQRFYEKHEDRYLELLWPSFCLVHDLDDTREKEYGVYYTQKRPLKLAALNNISPGI